MSVDVIAPVAKPQVPVAADPIEELSGYFFEDLEPGMTAAHDRPRRPGHVCRHFG